ncbi:uncharacterized protein ColSpa_08865 [Colletotrichum spaethianum]|uniref:Uncharacterized protein n=1 Tax=Colletotrichum spaethianum TaxID=700344 RepID=A0AA37PAK0_9PEZI|nr:uncharacterized protein ColSpa_08865 [Colletotrichum spaethianum]GKT48684.1 hypothetical protein ColSpa_08865 [Colletotrichum spaethianum]
MTVQPWGNVVAARCGDAACGFGRSRRDVTVKAVSRERKDLDWAWNDCFAVHAALGDMECEETHGPTYEGGGGVDEDVDEQKKGATDVDDETGDERRVIMANRPGALGCR